MNKKLKPLTVWAKPLETKDWHKILTPRKKQPVLLSVNHTPYLTPDAQARKRTLNELLHRIATTEWRAARFYKNHQAGDTELAIPDDPFLKDFAYVLEWAGREYLQGWLSQSDLRKILEDVNIKHDMTGRPGEARADLLTTRGTAATQLAQGAFVPPDQMGVIKGKQGFYWLKPSEVVWLGVEGSAKKTQRVCRRIDVLRTLVDNASGLPCALLLGERANRWIIPTNRTGRIKETDIPYGLKCEAGTKHPDRLLDYLNSVKAPQLNVIIPNSIALPVTGVAA